MPVLREGTSGGVCTQSTRSPAEHPPDGLMDLILRFQDRAGYARQRLTVTFPVGTL